MRLYGRCKYASDVISHSNLDTTRDFEDRSANTSIVRFHSHDPLRLSNKSLDALIVILKTPVHLQYQLAFLSDELECIFANAPVTRAPNHEEEPDESEESVYNGTRKPIEGECPICVFNMEPDEELVWCKAACGQNFHKVCFEQWRQSRRGGHVTCVYCRSEWQEDGMNPRKFVPGSLASLKETAPKIGSYKNIGHHPMYQQMEQKGFE